MNADKQRRDLSVFICVHLWLKMPFWKVPRRPSAVKRKRLDFGRTTLGEGKSGSVFLFRFRAEPSNFASKRGWMAGVAGPYWDDDESPDFASGTFSELTPFDSLTVEQHVESLRRASEKKGLVMPS